MHVNIGELFVGAGGLNTGFLLADHPVLRFRPLFSIDHDHPALETYRRNMLWLHEHELHILPNMPTIYEHDVEALMLADIGQEHPEIDLLLGGPPCQGFSSSNRKDKQAIKDARNRLIKVFFDRLHDIQPKMFLVENVQGVRWTQSTTEMHNGTRSVQEYMREQARKEGYFIWSDTLDAANFGVPQHRHRFFLFGVRHDLVQTDPDLSKWLIRQHTITVDDAIGDLPPLDNGEEWGGEDYIPSTNEYVQRMRRLLDNNILFDHRTTLHAPNVIERFRHVPEGGNWASIRELLTTTYGNIENTHSNIYRRLLRSAPAITIGHFRKSMIIHPLQHRGLSFREACRLQSFPDWYRFYGLREERTQQLANAVPPSLASTIARAIASYIVSQATLLAELTPETEPHNKRYLA